MNKHNVKSPRELEYAQIILATYQRIKAVAKYGLNKKRHFKEVMKEEADKKGVWFSILGDKDVMETLEGMGELTELIYKTEKKIQKIRKILIGGKINEQEYIDIQQYYKDMKESLGRILN